MRTIYVLHHAQELEPREIYHDMEPDEAERMIEQIADEDPNLRLVPIEPHVWRLLLTIGNPEKDLTIHREPKDLLQ